MNREDQGQRWSIGQLARATGLTVRTLYHYDEINLVRPAERTDAGHRLYTEADVRRLYRVRALRGLGLSLQEIATVLARAAAEDLSALRALLSAQLGELDAEAARIEQTRKHVSALLAGLTGTAMPDPERFLRALELSSRAQSYFTAQQREELLRRTTELGTDAVERMRAEAVELLQQARRCQLDGVAVDDPRVQELTKRIDEIGMVFHGGDHHVVAAANRMWRDTGADYSRTLDLARPDDGPNVVDYLHRARRVRTTAPGIPDPDAVHEPGAQT